MALRMDLKFLFYMSLFIVALVAANLSSMPRPPRDLVQEVQGVEVLSSCAGECLIVSWKAESPVVLERASGVCGDASEFERLATVAQPIYVDHNIVRNRPYCYRVGDAQEVDGMVAP